MYILCKEENPPLFFLSITSVETSRFVILFFKLKLWKMTHSNKPTFKIQNKTARHQQRTQGCID